MKVLLKVLLRMHKLKSLLFVFGAVSFTASAQIELKGHMKQGGLLIGKASPGSVVKLDGKSLAVSEQGDYVFGFGRDDEKSLLLEVTESTGKSWQKQIKPSKRQYNEQRIEGIPKKIMKPSKESQDRIAKDNKQIKKARSVSSDNTWFTQGFIAPIDGKITGVYGSRRIFNGEPKWPHFGLDYAGKTGDPVKSPADGKVLMYVPDMFYSGGTMIIDHGMGVSSTFLHLSDSYVKAGDQVKQGQVVAAVGSTGRSTGPHLDWRINWFGTRVDPALVLSFPKLN